MLSDYKAYLARCATKMAICTNTFPKAHHSETEELIAGKGPSINCKRLKVTDAQIVLLEQAYRDGFVSCAIKTNLRVQQQYEKLSLKTGLSPKDLMTWIDNRGKKSLLSVNGSLKDVRS